MADRYAGVPLLRALGLFRRRRVPRGEPERIGMLRASAIGDTILLSAIARDLRRRHPVARLVFFAGADNAGAAALIAEVDELVVIDLGRPWAAARELRRRRLDLLFDFGPWPRIEALLAAVSGAGCTVGFRTARQYRHYCFDYAVHHSDAIHELDNYRRMLEAIGIEPGANPAVTSREAGDPDLAPADRYVALHLWPGGFQSWRKEWPPDRWRALVRELARAGLRAVLTGGPPDRERSERFAGDCAREGLPVESVAGRLSLAGLLPLLRRAECLVSVNTGVMHLAAAAGVPTVGLNGPTSSTRWGPVGERCVAVDSELEGCGFLDLGFEYAGNREDCMEGISVARVLEAVSSVTGTHLPECGGARD